MAPAPDYQGTGAGLRRKCLQTQSPPCPLVPSLTWMLVLVLPLMLKYDLASPSRICTMLPTGVPSPAHTSPVKLREGSCTALLLQLDPDHLTSAASEALEKLHEAICPRPRPARGPLVGEA